MCVSAPPLLSPPTSLSLLPLSIAGGCALGREGLQDEKRSKLKDVIELLLLGWHL